LVVVVIVAAAAVVVVVKIMLVDVGKRLLKRMRLT